MPAIPRPLETEYFAYYHQYIRRVPEGDVLQWMEAQIAEVRGLLGGVDEARAAARPAPGEWTIKQVVGHLNDTERIFSYRALRFARGDQAALPGFDQAPYAEAAVFARVSLADLLEEFATLRRASLCLFRPLALEDLARSGVASDHPITVRALVYCLGGHVDHHLESLRTVYLPPAA